MTAEIKETIVKNRLPHLNAVARMCGVPGNAVARFQPKDFVRFKGK